MKKHLILSAAVVCAVTGLLGSCSEDVSAPSDGKGRIAPLVAMQSDIIEAEIVSKAVNTPDITAADLFFKVSSADGSFSKQWDLKDFDAAGEMFPVGDYKVEVGYGDPEKEDFDVHAYYDTQDVQVLDGRTTDVSLTASRTHAYVTVAFTEAFKAYLTRAAVGLVSASGKTTNFAYSSSYVETRTASIVPGLTAIYVDIEKQNGTTADHLKIAEFNTVARNHYSVTLDVNGGEVGSPVLSVSFDDSTADEDISIDISDEMLNTPAPEFALEGISDGAALQFVEGCWQGDPAKINIIAPGGLASVILDTRSTYLRDVRSWPESVDLIGCDQTKQDRFTSAGLKSKGLWGENVGRMAFVDFTDVFNNLISLDSDLSLDNVTTFSLSVVDKNGKTAQAPVSFSVKVDRLQIALSNPSDMSLVDTDLDFDMSFNGGDPGDAVSFFVQRNDRGTGTYFDPVTVAAIEKTSDNNYRVSLSDIPVEGTSVTVRAQYGSRTADLTVNRSYPEFSLSTASGAIDIFATKAYVSIECESLDPVVIAPMATFWAGTKKLTAERIDNSATFLISGLTAGTNYNIAASIFNDAQRVCSPLTFTTESAAQLPDAGFDSWSSVKKGDYQYLWKVEDSGSWATVNELTTSQNGSGSGSGIRTGGCAYKATSGTIPANGRSNYSNSYGGTFGTTKDADGHTTGNANLHSNLSHTGLNAALVRTVGYGSGNDAGSGTGNPASGFSTCKNVASGELFLGTYSGGPVYSGCQFASRPSSLTFYYKYTSYGSSGDYGDCEVIVKDASGNTIASASSTIGAKDSYTQMTLPLTYTRSCAKAATIMVRFKSSANPALTNNSTWLYGPGNKNVSGGEYVGSELYIDDIQLIY